MADCLVTNGIGINCDDLRRVGGVDKDFYLANHDELVNVGYDSSNYINDINFTAYKGLYKFKSRKQAHSGGYTPQVSGPGGNKYFQHDVTAKLYPATPDEDAILEALLVGTVVIILETNNDEFILYGLKKGMDQTEGVQNSGTEDNSDVGYNLTFAGAEKEIPKRVLVGGTAEATRNYLETLVV